MDALISVNLVASLRSEDNFSDFRGLNICVFLFTLEFLFDFKISCFGNSYRFGCKYLQCFLIFPDHYSVVSSSEFSLIRLWIRKMLSALGWKANLKADILLNIPSCNCLIKSPARLCQTQ